MKVQAAPKESYAWLLERIGYRPGVDFTAIEARDDAGNIGAMVGFDLWKPGSVQLHVAIESPACAKAIIRPAFQYPFLQHGCSVVLGLIPSPRAKCVEFVRRLGFEKICQVRDGWDAGADLLVFELRKENCRWIRQGRTA